MRFISIHTDATRTNGVFRNRYQEDGGCWADTPLEMVGCFVIWEHRRCVQ